MTASYLHSLICSLMTKLVHMIHSKLEKNHILKEKLNLRVPFQRITLMRRLEHVLLSASSQMGLCRCIFYVDSVQTSTIYSAKANVIHSEILLPTLKGTLVIALSSLQTSPFFQYPNLSEHSEISRLCKRPCALFCVITKCYRLPDLYSCSTDWRVFSGDKSWHLGACKSMLTNPLSAGKKAATNWRMSLQHTVVPSTAEQWQSARADIRRAYL